MGCIQNKLPCWGFFSYFPFAICLPASNFAAAFTYASARKQDPFIAHNKDSMAINLIWCVWYMHPLLYQGTSTEGFREVCEQKCRVHSAKAFPEPHLRGCITLWKCPQLLLVRAQPFQHFYTVPFCWAIVFFNYSLTERQRHRLSVQGGAESPAILWATGEPRNWRQAQHAAADPACLAAELPHHRQNSNLF